MIPADVESVIIGKEPTRPNQCGALHSASSPQPHYPWSSTLASMAMTERRRLPPLAIRIGRLTA